MSEQALPLPGLAGPLAVSFVSLGFVCVLAYVTLRWLSRRGFAGHTGGPVRVLARCALEPRRSVYVIEAAGRCFMVGVGEGPMSLLAELDKQAFLANLPAPTGRGGRFKEILQDVLARGTRGRPPERQTSEPAGVAKEASTS